MTGLFSGQLPMVTQLLAVGAVSAITAMLLAALMRGLDLPSGIPAYAWVSWAGHFVLGCLLVSTRGLEASDAYGYHVLASQVANHLVDGSVPLPELVKGKEGWVWLLGLLYATCGATPAIGVALNAAFLAGGLCLISRLTLDISRSPKAAKVAAFLFLVVPGHVFWGSIPLREASVAFCCSGIAYCSYQSMVGGRLGSWVSLIVFLGGLSAIRGGMGILIGVALSLVYAMRLTVTSGGIGKKVLAMGATGALLAIALSTLGNVSPETSTDRIDTIRSAQSSEASTGFDTGGAVAGRGIVSTAVVGLPRVLVGPYPWEVGVLKSLFPFSVYWWVILSLVWVGIRARTIERGALLVLLFPMLALLIALSVYSGNYGTMIRLRDQTLPFLLPLAAIGWVGLGHLSKSQSPRVVEHAR